MNIIINKIDNNSQDFQITPASSKRDWMDVQGNFPYKCLPLKIGNQLGWNVLCPLDFAATWNGEINHVNSFKLEFFGENKDQADLYIKNKTISSHFGNGILTFSLPYIFKTPKGIGIFVRGPTNYVKHNITYLDAFIETDWLDFSFTYNIKFQQPNTKVEFKKDEPLFTFYPLELSSIEDIQFTYQDIKKDKKLHENFIKYSQLRNDFNKKINNNESKDPNFIKEFGSSPWMKDYYNAQDAERKEIGCPFLNKFGKFIHNTKLSLKEIADE